MRQLLALLVLSCSASACAQLAIWAEEFENGCVTGCYASAYATGPNGAWTVTNTGANGACANRWFISCRENGNAVGACGTDCTSSNETLHLGNELVGVCASPNGCAFCPPGDCGAAYDAGCPAALCSICTILCGNCSSTLTDQRAESPVINLTGYSTITLSFKYMENGQGTSDNATLWYFDGAAWSQLSDPAKTATGCAGGQGLWTAYSIALPASANNNPTVRVGFRWVNNNDGSGADPSFAVDDVQLTVPYTPACNGPIINEVSNGPAGAQEYIELLVCGPSCSTVDLRNFKIDDNNGVLMNGFGTTLAGSGTAAGHLRFNNAAQWAAVPAGSLILIYNNTELNPLLPPDDPGDLSPVDSVYVLGANNALLQGCGTLPNPASTSNYNTGCVFGVGNWNYISLRNQGDAAQTRYPNGNYYHGVSYGSNANGMNNGGIDLLRISTLDHTGRVIYFNTGNYRVAANYTSAAIAGNETPGAPNNAVNAAYILALECLTTPVELMHFTADAIDGRVRLDWATATELDNDFFSVERSTDAVAFSIIGTVDGGGTSLHERHYVFDDIAPIEGLAYYRLRQTDFDGTTAMGRSVPVEYRSPALINVTAAEGEVTISGSESPGTWIVFDLLGRPIAFGELTVGGATRLGTSVLSATLLILRVRNAGSAGTFKITRVGGNYLAMRVE